MDRLARVFGAIRRLMRNSFSPRECEADRPASFAELAAASAFLDFGGMPSGDWLHAWEASVESDRRLGNKEIPPATVVPHGAPGNRHIGESFEREKAALDPCRPRHAARDLTDRGVFPFHSRDGEPMLLINELNGCSHTRADSELGVLDLAMCIAAFGLVAGVLVFARPTSPTSPKTNTTTTEAAGTTPPQIGTTLSRLSGQR
jgi:hypothetical protein